MELYFCDLCQEAVPKSDLDARLAFATSERVVCSACNRAMGGVEPFAAPVDSGTPSSAGQTVPNERSSKIVVGRRGPALISPALGAVLGLAAIILTLVAVVALLARIEMLSRALSGRFDEFTARIDRVEMRQHGTRDGMVAGAQRIAEDAVYKELGRFDEFERQLGELRLALAAGTPRQEGEGEPMGVDQLLTLGDAMSKVDDLENEVLFLQARMFELLEETKAESRGEPPVLERLLLPSGEVGKLVAQLAHEDPIERVSALYALAMVEDKGIVRHITPLLKDSDAYIRALSARILERLKARSAAQDLIGALSDVDVGVRASAVSALREISGQQFGFNPRGPGNERFSAIKRWKDWWGDNWKVFLYSEE